MHQNLSRLIFIPVAPYLPGKNPSELHMNVSKKQITTINEYIQNFPEDVREILEKMRQTIQEAAPEATETISLSDANVQTGWQKSCLFCGV